MQFRDWSGMFHGALPQHTVHEDNAMLLTMGDRQRRVALPASSPDAIADAAGRHVPSTDDILRPLFEENRMKINSRVVALFLVALLFVAVGSRNGPDARTAVSPASIVSKLYHSGLRHPRGAETGWAKPSPSQGRWW